MTSPSTPALTALAESGIDFEVRVHGRVGSLEEAAAARGVKPADLIKTMVVRRGDDDYVLVLVPGDRVIAWPKLRRLLGVSRLSMPDADEAKRVTGYPRGTITPFGTTTDLPVIADERIVGRRISMGGGDHGVGVLIEADDVIEHTRAAVADVTEPSG